MRTISRSCSKAAALAAALLMIQPPSRAQSNLLSVAPPQKITVKRDAEAEVKLAVKLQPGYHVNSNTPAEDYLIPLRLRWEPGALNVVEITYPKAQLENYDFSDKPVSVFTGDFEIVTKVKPDAKASPGPGVMAGKLRYQACNNTTCFPPKTIDVKLPFSVQ